jgi:hypothetical protein
MLKEIQVAQGLDEEEVEEDIKMENVRQTFDLFIQNTLKATSHSLEWLPIGHQDPDFKDFNQEYFLIGTHHEVDQS